ncbi:hypothetical protein [Chachezhania antarctica]|uniref:hypothetical protein n=1 Tax=Chachezhania antarctica TaxID=2340860 RepID=UPI000EAD4BD4|nr:hypothetical protein [Chachezhania antarctica]|tara:strand:+ start:7487 stop:7741 length:255 start_codon:yes stop_codon:yes gene_type:complete
MRFAFPHSHAFRGGRVTVEDDGGAPPACLVEFSDGVTVMGEFRHDGPDIVLDVPAYRTSKGTDVGARRWRLSRSEAGVWRTTRM